MEKLRTETATFRSAATQITQCLQEKKTGRPAAGLAGHSHVQPTSLPATHTVGLAVTRSVRPWLSIRWATLTASRRRTICARSSPTPVRQPSLRPVSRRPHHFLSRIYGGRNFTATASTLQQPRTRVGYGYGWAGWPGPLGWPSRCEMTSPDELNLASSTSIARLTHAGVRRLSAATGPRWYHPGSEGSCLFFELP